MRHLKLYLTAAATAVALSAVAGYAQNTAHEHAAPPAPGQTGMMNGQMMANMQAEQKKLDELVAQMNAATGPDKVDKIAAAVTEMAAMHKQMSGMMMMMRGNMMQMPHGATGAPQSQPNN